MGGDTPAVGRLAAERILAEQEQQVEAAPQSVEAQSATRAQVQLAALFPTGEQLAAERVAESLAAIQRAHNSGNLASTVELLGHISGKSK